MGCRPAPAARGSGTPRPARSAWTTQPMEHNTTGTEMRKRQYLIANTISTAFGTAHLLTGSVQQAENAVLKAIQSFDLNADDEEAFFHSTLHAAVQCPDEVTLRSTSNQPSRTGLFIPTELQAVLDLGQNSRHCFVLRVLAGMSRHACARLLQLTTSSVDQNTCAALQCLAGFEP